jgi:plastocyanin
VANDQSAELRADAGEGQARDVASAALKAGLIPPDPVRDRLVLPLLLPILTIGAVALYVLNISRVFLAGGSGAASVIIASIVTVAILVGGAVISSMPRLRSSTLTTTVALLVVIVMSGGMITLGPSEGHGRGSGGGYQEPAGAATTVLEVDAGPGTKFQAEEFTQPEGILEIKYVDKGEPHTLVFAQPEFAGFKLATPQGPTKRKVKLEEGEYTIYCNIPGHRDSGMEATLTVTGPEPARPDSGGAPATGP